jgi:4-hydroxythreonine-4-phosphate dehydrogenase
VAVSALADGSLLSLCRPVVYGDEAILRRAAALLGVSPDLAAVPEGAEPPPGAFVPGRIAVRAVSRLSPGEAPFGVLTEAGARGQAAYIRAAAEDVLAGRADGIVTCPVSKEGLHRAGVPHPGHTEYLAALCGGADVAMMLAGDRLRVALATIHVSLRRSLELLSAPLVERTVRITDAFFRRYMGCAAPRIAVAGVNPHAGEGGLFGDEEGRFVVPALEACRRDGIDASGPHPADTVFHRAYRGDYDVVVAMNHDQGLGPLKLVHFDDGVNVTMGLPIVRTSVDHGTAYDIAGKGIASPASLKAAIRMAASMAARGR